MLCYVAYKYGGDKENIYKAVAVTRELQLANPDDTYITPLLAFSYLEYGELDYDDEMEHCLELLRMCDKLIVASDISNGVAIEILEAKEMGIDIEYLEEAMT